MICQISSRFHSSHVRERIATYQADNKANYAVCLVDVFGQNIEIYGRCVSIKL